MAKIWSLLIKMFGCKWSICSDDFALNTLPCYRRVHGHNGWNNKSYFILQRKIFKSFGKNPHLGFNKRSASDYFKLGHWTVDSICNNFMRKNLMRFLYWKQIIQIRLKLLKLLTDSKLESFLLVWLRSTFWRIGVDLKSYFLLLIYFWGYNLSRQIFYLIMCWDVTKTGFSKFESL